MFLRKTFRYVILPLFLLAILPRILSAGEKPEIFVQMGHDEKVGRVGFSPDGRYALAGDVSGITKLWDTTNGREIKTLPCYLLAFSHNNRYALLLEAKKKMFKLWDMTKKEVISTYKIKADIEIKEMGAISAAVSDDGRFVLFGGDRDFGLWDLQEVKEIQVENSKKIFTGHKAYINSIAFSPDGKYVLSGSNDKTVRLWDIATGEQVRIFEGHAYDVYAATFSPDGRYIMSGSADDTAKLWDVMTGKEIRTFKHESSVFLTTFSPEGRFALTSSNGIKIWDTVTGEDILLKVKAETIAKIKTETEIKVKAEVEARNKAYALSYANEVAKAQAEGKSPPPQVMEEEVYIDDHEIKEAWEKEWHLEDCACSAAYSPDGKQILTGSWRSLNLWDSVTGKEIKTEAKFLGYADEISSVIFSSNGRLVVSATSRGAIVIWDLAEGKRKAEWRSNISAIAASSDGKFILSGSSDEYPGGLKFWDLTTGKQIWSIEGHKKYVHSLAFSPDGKHALSASEDGTVKLWNIETKEEIKAFKESGHFDPGSVAFSPDGKYILLYGDNYFVNLLDIKSGAQIQTYHWCEPPYTFSPNGKHFACSNGSIFDVKTSEEIIKLEGLEARSLAYSPDGKYILSGGFNDILQLWDCQDRKIKWEIPLQSHWIESVAFSPDGKYAASASYNGAINLFEVETGKRIGMLAEFREQKKSFDTDTDWSAPDWVIITPDGYFNASPNGAKHLNVRVGNNVYSIDNFYEKFFNPVYVASVLQGKKIEAVADIRKGILMPPDVKIISPEPNATFSTDTITITVSAKDTDGGIDEIRLYHNGKAIGEDQRAIKIVPKGNEVIKTYTVTLIDGINTFRAVGFSKDRTESNPYELIVKLTAPQKDVSMYIFTVGINKYKNPALNLNYAEPDAKGIVDFFKHKGKGLFKNVELREIYNEQATKENITAKLKQLENTNPQDAVLIYLAGHGESIGDNWYFIPHELTYPEREEDVRAKGISSNELTSHIKDIKAQKILVLIDACKAGAVLIAFRGFEDRKALSQLSRATGVHVIAASTKDQFAAEVKDLGHGVFTYTLLEGLKGKAAGEGETVTVRKLMGYVEEQLPDITKKYKQEAQYPVVDSKGMDFPLVIGR